jgi:phosphate acyltransferase
VVGLSLVRDGRADAFVSAGSTGAVMAASLFILRRLEGVERPPVATTLPTAAGPVIMVDGGANVDCKPQHLLQFAKLGAIYVRDVMDRENPRIGLLNIGEEPEKGNELAVEAHKLLRESSLNFIGNIEGRDVPKGGCDVIVTDGFVGNVLLKLYESVAGYILGLVTREIALKHPDFKLQTSLDELDYASYGGAPLLGVNGVSMICHGGSPPRALRNAIRNAVHAVENDMVGDIRRAMVETADAAPERAQVEGA